jgi:hypothetical protein
LIGAREILAWLRVDFEKTAPPLVKHALAHCQPGVRQLAKQQKDAANTSHGVPSIARFSSGKSERIL